MAAFVLGNGTSRSTIDVAQLLSLGAVYGCNALYRTHTPTCLVATDKAIATEIQESGYSRKARFHTRRPMPEFGALPVPKKYFGFSSGPIATSLAAEDGHIDIYLLGFDMGPSLIGKFNNIYADTEFYKKTESSPTFTGNWIKQLITVMNDHRHQNFIRVHGSTTADISEFAAIGNHKKMGLADFLERINTPKDL